MGKLKIKKEDTVLVLAGTSKGSKGKVVKVIPSENRAIVEGVNMVSKHTKPNARQSNFKSKKKYLVLMDDRIVDFLSNNHLLSLATSKENLPHCIMATIWENMVENIITN